jgi:NitT/TauT family transport system permease protein
VAAVASLERKNPSARATFWSVRRAQIAALVLILALWQAAGASGLFFRGVLPSIVDIAGGLWRILGTADFYRLHLATTGYEVAAAFVIGASLGALVGLALGIQDYAGKVGEPLLYYLAPTPKIVFLPILLVLFGVGPGSKIALGALSCFFPMALSVAAGVKLVPSVYLRVGRSLRLSVWQMVRRIYLPALVPPISSGLRLGLGLAIVGCLLSEIKLSNRGIGFLAMEYYRRFDIPAMLAVLCLIFALAAGLNILIATLVRLPGPAGRNS